MTKTDALKLAAWETIALPLRASFWVGFAGALVAVLAMLAWVGFRILLIITFPISIPLMALAIHADHRKTEMHVAEIMERLRKDIHKNGKTKP